MCAAPAETIRAIEDKSMWKKDVLYDDPLHLHEETDSAT